MPTIAADSCLVSFITKTRNASLANLPFAESGLCLSAAAASAEALAATAATAAWMPMSHEWLAVLLLSPNGYG